MSYVEMTIPQAARFLKGKLSIIKTRRRHELNERVLKEMEECQRKTLENKKAWFRKQPVIFKDFTSQVTFDQFLNAVKAEIKMGVRLNSRYVLIYRFLTDLQKIEAKYKKDSLLLSKLVKLLQAARNSDSKTIMINENEV
jgi:hypothetical protein